MLLYSRQGQLPLFISHAAITVHQINQTNQHAQLSTFQLPADSAQTSGKKRLELMAESKLARVSLH